MLDYTTITKAMDRLDIPYQVDNQSEVCKGITIKEVMGPRRFLVITTVDRDVQPGTIRDQILTPTLMLTPEEVISPFDLIDDNVGNMEVILDLVLLNKQNLLFKADNETTIKISYEGLQKLININGNTTRFVRLEFK